MGYRDQEASSQGMVTAVDVSTHYQLYRWCSNWLAGNVNVQVLVSHEYYMAHA